MKQYRDRAMYQTHDGAWMRFTYLESEVLMVIGVVFLLVSRICHGFNPFKKSWMMSGQWKLHPFLGVGNEFHVLMTLRLKNHICFIMVSLFACFFSHAAGCFCNKRL